MLTTILSLIHIHIPKNRYFNYANCSLLSPEVQ